MSILHTLKRKLRSCRRQQDGVLDAQVSAPVHYSDRISGDGNHPIRDVPVEYGEAVTGAQSCINKELQSLLELQTKLLSETRLLRLKSNSQPQCEVQRQFLEHNKTCPILLATRWCFRGPPHRENSKKFAS